MTDKKPDKKLNYGKTNRTKGHNAERKYAKIFRDFGFTHCKTARYASTMSDDAGIDLVFLPINVQIKAGKQRGLNPINELKLMDGKIAELFPPDAPEHGKPNIVLIEKATGQGVKRTKYDTTVTMAFDDFINFLTP